MDNEVTICDKSAGNLYLLHITRKFHFLCIACADPESFVRLGPTLTTFFVVFYFVDERIKIPL